MGLFHMIIISLVDELHRCQSQGSAPVADRRDGHIKENKRYQHPAYGPAQETAL